MTDWLRGERFRVSENGRTVVTPLLLVLLMVEGADIVFAVDSIPAVFAILGLRSLYFALAPLLAYFRFLKTSLVLVLAFVGVKMLLAHHYTIEVTASLAVILGLLALGAVGGSLVVVGSLFLLIPGLGLKVIVAGLAVLAPQFVWARKLLAKAKTLPGMAPPVERDRPPDG